MKKCLFFLFFLLCTLVGRGQNFSPYAGGNFSVFRSIVYDHLYEPNGTDFLLGYNIGVDITETYLGLVNIRYQKTGGSFYFKNEKKFLTSELTLKTIGLGLYPINLNIRKIFFIHAGFEASYKLSSTLEDEAEYRDFFDYGAGRNIIPPEESIHRNWNFGLGLMFSHNIEISDKLVLCPRARLYFGISNEFKNEIAKTALRTMSYEIVFKYNQ